MPTRFSPARRSSQTTSGRRWTPSVWRSGRSPPPLKENCTWPCCSIGGAGIPGGLPRQGFLAKYPGLLPGSGSIVGPFWAFTINQGPSPQVRRVVVAEGWTPKPPSDSPPKEASGEEVTTTEAAKEMTPEPKGAQAPPSEGQEDAQGEMVTLDMGPLALGPRRVHLALMYEW